MEGIGTCVGTEATGYFLFDLEFADPAFRGIIVRGYGRVLQKVEDVIPAFDQSPFQLVELFSQIVKILFEQLVKP